MLIALLCSKAGYPDKTAEVALRFGESLLGSQAIPLHRFDIVLRHAFADGVHETEVVLRIGIASLGRQAIPLQGFVQLRFLVS